MNDQVGDNQAKKAANLQYLMLLVVLIVLAVVAAVGYKAWQKWSAPAEPISITEEERIAAGDTMRQLYDSESAPLESQLVSNITFSEEATAKDISGSVFFSGQVIGAPRVTRLFELDLDVNTTDVGSTSAGVDYFLDNHAVSAMAEFVDPADPNEFFFLTAPSVQISSHLHRYNPETDEITAYPRAAGNNMRSISWSPSTEKIVYERLSEAARNSGNLLDINNWEAVIFDPAADEIVKVIENVRKPLWIAERNELLFFREDGLYRYAVETEEESKLMGMPEGGKVVGVSGVDLSTDGKYLVWSSGKEGTVVVYETPDWNLPAPLKEIGRYTEPGAEFYNPQFSPDGEYYVLQAIDAETADNPTRENPRLEFRQTTSREVVYTYPLDLFAFNLLFTDDWVASQD